jgi:chromosome partitioning protein
LRAYSLINLADTQGRDNEDALSALRGVEGVDALPFVVGRRKAFPNAFSNGLSVIEHMLRDQKAADELLAVVGALYTQEAHDDYSSGPQRKVG